MIDGSWGLCDALWSCFVYLDGSTKLTDVGRKKVYGLLTPFSNNSIDHFGLASPLIYTTCSFKTHISLGRSQIGRNVDSWAMNTALLSMW